MSDSRCSDCSPSLANFLGELDNACRSGSFTRLILSKYTGPEADLEKLTVRPVTVREEQQCSFVYRYRTRDITQNHSFAEAVALLGRLLGPEFRNAHLITAEEEVQLSFSKKDKVLTTRKRLSSTTVPAPAASHDREKQRHVDVARPFLKGLGVTDERAQVIPAMSRKWKQINKFVEIFSRAFEASRLKSQTDIHVVDFGSGKGYLTFALHDYLQQQANTQVTVTGVELRDELVVLCEKVARQCGLQGLQFYQGDVRSWHPPMLNVMIALHACDIATDYAIHMGIRSGADIIMCSPCCHKQLRPQMKAPELLAPMLKHGIHMGQEAEMLTDSLRALLLEAWGYETQVFEFISLEHTSKNKMILAIRKGDNPRKAELLSQIESLMNAFGITSQELHTLLTATPVPTQNS